MDALQSWKEISLGKLAQYLNGKAFKPADWKKSGVPIIRIQNLTNPSNPFNYFDGTIEDRYRINTGDLLISWSATLGSFIWDRGPAVLNQHIFKVIPDEEIVDKEFLYYLVLNTLGEMAKHSHGLAMKHITKKKFEALPVKVPKLAEQRRIVARIKECMERVEEIEGLRAEAMQQRDYLLESLIETEYHNAEGDKVILSEVCAITSGLVDPREQRYIDLFHVGGANIEAKIGKLLEMKTAKEEKLKSSKFVFDTSMVLYNKIRPYLMKVVRPDFSGLCSADMYPLAPDPERLTRDYLFYLLLSRNFTDYAISGSNRAGMPKVNRKHLFAYKFTLPSIQVQQSITERLDIAASAVDKLRADMSCTASEANAIRESILRKAFAWEL